MLPPLTAHASEIVSETAIVPLEEPALAGAVKKAARDAVKACLANRKLHLPIT